MSETDALLIGGYTGGERRGLELVTVGGDWPRVAEQALTNPSWLVAGVGDTVLAVGESDGSAVTLLVLDDISPDSPDGLAIGPTLDLSGSGACHGAVAGSFLVVAHYGSGSVSAVQLDATGAPVRETAHLQFTGSGADAERQEAPHAHQVVVDGDELLVCDLGTDRVHRLRLTPEGALETAAPALELPAGFGPRHLVRTGDLVVVLGELRGELWLGRIDAEHVHQLDLVPSTGHSGSQPSGLRIDADGLLWSAQRGPDTIAVHRIEDDRLVLVTEFASGGRWPRDLVLVDDLLLVANQESAQVTVFDRAQVLAGPAEPRHQIHSHDPTAILPLGPSTSAREDDTTR